MRGNRHRLARLLAALMMVAGLLTVAGPALAHDPPDLVVTKTAVQGTIDAGQVAAFTIEVKNVGIGGAENVVLTDVLPDSGLDWFEDPDSPKCTITPDPGGDILQCTATKMAPGESFSVTVKAQTDAENCGTLVNRAVVRASNEPAELLGNNEATASITVVCEEPPGGEGCTPGFWKNHQSLWDGVPPDVTTSVQTTDGFNATFGVTSAQSGLANSVTMLGAMNLGGGGLRALARHAAAAAANADSQDYAFTLAQVIALYRDAVGADPGPATVQSAHAAFEAANESDCAFDD